MKQIPPFYSLRQLVYHTNDDCPDAKLVSESDRRDGTGGKVECLCCIRYNKQLLKRSLQKA